MILLLIFLLYATLLSVGLARRGYRTAAGTPVPAPGGTPERVLIVGATGGTGRELVAQALERGLLVTAFVRDPSRIRIKHPRLRVVRGDVLDTASLDAAVKGQGAVVSALGHKHFFSPTRVLSAGTSNVLRAMEANGVKRFVCETSLGIGNSAGRMGLYYTFFTIPVILPFYFWDKARQERLIAASKVDWVIVRPGLLTNGARRGTHRHGRSVGSYLWTARISRADVADFMLKQLADNTYLRGAPGVCW